MLEGGIKQESKAPVKLPKIRIVAAARDLHLPSATNATLNSEPKSEAIKINSSLVLRPKAIAAASRYIVRMVNIVVVIAKANITCNAFCLSLYTSSSSILPVSKSTRKNIVLETVDRGSSPFTKGPSSSYAKPDVVKSRHAAPPNTVEAKAGIA